MIRILLLSSLMVPLLNWGSVQPDQKDISDLSWREVIHKLPEGWYGSHEAIRVADNVLLYQQNIGGWPKEVPMHYVLSRRHKRELRKLKPIGLGATIDNGATCQELIFLSKVYGKTGREAYKSAFLTGVNFLIEAQYKNGGWPQFYPLEQGDYSTHITYNDDAMVNAMRVMKSVAENSGAFSIEADDAKVAKAKLAFEKGLNTILKTQYKQHGVLTAWCAQHDEHTLEPAKARSYELPSLSGGESAGIVLLLMEINDPSPEVVNSVKAAVDWFERVKISGLGIENFINEEGAEDLRVFEDKDAPDTWARFYDLKDNRPFFSDRDGIKKYTVAEIGQERRGGYAWYTDDPQEVLDIYEQWQASFGTDPQNSQSAQAASRFNILFLISDDMNDWTGCLDGHPDAITRSLDRLAERVVLFEQTHCSAPICNPSRASGWKLTHLAWHAPRKYFKMYDPDALWDRPALTTHGKGNHTLRSKRSRYTRYRDCGEELCNQSQDDMEWKNLADDPAYALVKAELKK